MKLAGDYQGEEIPICLLMGMWLRHIDCFKRKYDKVFENDPLFGADFMDRIHKRVQVFLHSCNTTTIEDMESVALADFRAEVHEGVMDITPTNHPHQYRQSIWGGGQNCWYGGGLAQQKKYIMGKRCKSILLRASSDLVPSQQRGN